MSAAEVVVDDGLHLEQRLMVVDGMLRGKVAGGLGDSVLVVCSFVQWCVTRGKLEVGVSVTGFVVECGIGVVVVA